MIYRVSIPAFEPVRVASVLATLTGGDARPFRSGLPGSFMVRTDRAAIEVHPEQGADECQDFSLTAAAEFDPDGPAALRFPLSVPTDRPTIEKIGVEQGWYTRHSTRGLAGEKAPVTVVEFWIENRVLAELMPDDRVAATVAQLETIVPEHARPQRVVA